MRVVVRKLEGVRDVNVSLKSGVATIHFLPSNRVRVAQIRQAVRSNGFTPRAADVRVSGSLAQRGDSLVLAVGGSGDAFVLRDAPGAPGQVASLRGHQLGTRVTLNGTLPEAPGKSTDAPATLFVRSAALSKS